MIAFSIIGLQSGPCFYWQKFEYKFKLNLSFILLDLGDDDSFDLEDSVDYCHALFSSLIALSNMRPNFKFGLSFFLINTSNS